MSFTYTLYNTSSTSIVANKTNTCETRPIPTDLPNLNVGGAQCQLYYSGELPLDLLSHCCLNDTGINNLDGCFAWCRTDRNTSDWANCVFEATENRSDPTAWHARCGNVLEKTGGAVFRPTSSAAPAKQSLSTWALIVLFSAAFSLTL